VASRKHPGARDGRAVAGRARGAFFAELANGFALPCGDPARVGRIHIAMANTPAGLRRRVLGEARLGLTDRLAGLAMEQRGAACTKGVPTWRASPRHLGSTLLRSSQRRKLFQLR
jgi:hypothetical protein